MSNPFVKNFQELLSNIREDLGNSQEIDSLYIASDEEGSIFIKLLVQPLYRVIDGHNTTFLSIRTVEMKEPHKGQGLFKMFLAELEALNVPLLFHDLINPRLHAFLCQQGYSTLMEEKYGKQIVSLYKLAAPDHKKGQYVGISNMKK